MEAAHIPARLCRAASEARRVAALKNNLGDSPFRQIQVYLQTEEKTQRSQRILLYLQGSNCRRIVGLGVKKEEVWCPSAELLS